MRESRADTDGLPLVHDAVGMLVHGDVIIVLHEASASLSRSRWLFSTFEGLPGSSYIVVLVIGDTARPPDQVSRDRDAQAFKRIAPKLRRLITVSEGGNFRTSFVRLIMNAYALLTGRRHIFAFAQDHAQAQAWLQESRTALTPSTEQLQADLARLRHAVQQAPRSSMPPT